MIRCDVTQADLTGQEREIVLTRYRNMLSLHLTVFVFDVSRVAYCTDELLSSESMSLVEDWF